MSIIKSYEKEFVFLGHRDYVQGSTLTYGLMEAANNWGLGSIERIAANMHALLNEHGQYDLYLQDNKPLLSGKAYNALFQISSDYGSYVVGLKGNGEQVSDRQTYDEDGLIEGYRLVETDRSALLETYPHSPFVNIVIALNKKLVGKLFPAAGYGQWFLARYDFLWGETYLTEPKLLEIKITGNIGMSHIHSRIKLGDKSVGSIYFSRNQL